MKQSAETIAAIATPAGKGGVGIVRVSGPLAPAIGAALAGRAVPLRVATLATFRDASGAVLDRGILLRFASPHSYTGEDVLELHGHGGIAVMHALLARVIELGGRLALPGEFTQRAFLNEKLDLAEAEGVADLIEASSLAAVKSAARSLVGEFSDRVTHLTESLVELRMHVEACIDFPEEEIDPADRALQVTKLLQIRAALDRLTVSAKQGAVLRDGLTVALIGKPNVGKSSLLNRLAGEDLAIVTPIAGTTRDAVRATIYLEGVPIHLVDTAGLRETEDPIEKIGIERTWATIENAGAALLLVECGEGVGAEEANILGRLPAKLPVVLVENKADLVRGAHVPRETNPIDHRLTGAALRTSALTGAGLEAVCAWLLDVAGWQPQGEGVIMARKRHLNALHATQTHLDAAASVAAQYDLFAEELRLAQRALSEITGEFTPDDLLGEIFGRFCIGK